MLIARWSRCFRYWMNTVDMEFGATVWRRLGGRRAMAGAPSHKVERASMSDHGKLGVFLLSSDDWTLAVSACPGTAQHHDPAHMACVRACVHMICLFLSSVADRPASKGCR